MRMAQGSQGLKFVSQGQPMANRFDRLKGLAEDLLKGDGIACEMIISTVNAAHATCAQEIA
jgi:hypothetical protein